MPNITTSLLYNWFQQVWNEGRETAIDDLFDENGIANGLENDIKGPAGFKAFYNDFRSKFSDIKIKVDEVVAEADMEVARCTLEAIHSPSNTRVNFSGLAMVKIKDGKITEAWNHFDFMNMYQQLGHKLVAPQN